MADGMRQSEWPPPGLLLAGGLLLGTALVMLSLGRMPSTASPVSRVTFHALTACWVLSGGIGIVLLACQASWSFVAACAALLTALVRFLWRLTLGVPLASLSWAVELKLGVITALALWTHFMGRRPERWPGKLIVVMETPVVGFWLGIDVAITISALAP